MSPRRGRVVAAVALLAAACTRAARPAAPAAAAPADSVRLTAGVQPAPVRVENRHHADVVVYVVRGNVRTRLGTVTAGSTRALRIPASHVGDVGGLYLVADPVGDRGAVRSERFIVRPDQQVVWSLETSLARSTVSVY